MAEGQPFINDPSSGGFAKVYDEIRNAIETGGNTTLYTVEQGIPAGGIQVEYAPVNVNPVVQFLDSIRQQLPTWLWIVVGFVIILFYFRQK